MCLCAVCLLSHLWTPRGWGPRRGLDIGGLDASLRQGVGVRCKFYTWGRASHPHCRTAFWRCLFFVEFDSLQVSFKIIGRFLCSLLSAERFLLNFPGAACLSHFYSWTSKHCLELALEHFHANGDSYICTLHGHEK